MSVVNDATRRARDAVGAAEQLVRQLEADLAAVPGWLRVGDPTRHADPADAADAASAVLLNDRLDRARRALAQLRDRVEQVLGDPPSGIFAFVAYSEWLAGLPPADPQRLLDELVTSPERLLTGPGVMAPEKAQAILDHASSHGGRVGDGEAFRTGVPLDAADLADLEATGARLQAGAAAVVDWDVLLPVRLGTRFTPPDPAAAPGDPTAVWRLRVRVEPDSPSLARQPGPVNARDAELVATCWTEAAGGLNGDLGEAAHRKLAAAVGGGRADYLLRTVPVVRTDAGFTPADDLPERLAPTTAPHVGLPGTLEIWGGPADAPQRLLSLSPDLATIALDTDLERVAEPVDGETPRRWWNSYAAAEDVGLAGEIALGPDRPHLEVLLCLGFGDAGTAPTALFRTHADSGRIEPLSALTPTTTLAGSPTTDLGSDPAPWLQAARDAPDDVGGLADVLVGQTSWPGVPAATTACAGRRACSPRPSGRCCGSARSRTSPPAARRSGGSASGPGGTCTPSARIPCSGSGTFRTACCRSPTTTAGSRGRPSTGSGRRPPRRAAAAGRAARAGRAAAGCRHRPADRRGRRRRHPARRARARPDLTGVRLAEPAPDAALRGPARLDPGRPCARGHRCRVGGPVRLPARDLAARPVASLLPAARRRAVAGAGGP